MKKIIEITLKAAVAVLAILLAASCVFEKENPVGRANGRQHVAVQLGIGTEGMAQTKADDNTGIPITTPDAENPVPTIETKIKTLRIYAYTKEGANYKLCGYYQAFAKADGTFNTTGHVMDLNLPSSGTVKVYFRAVANESAMLPGGDKTGSIADNYAINVGRDPQTGGLVFPDAIGFDELNNILYTVDQKFQNGMPMYADQEVSINVDNVGSMNTDDGHNGHFILQETVNLTLTRSLAKIEVYAAEDAGEGSSTEVIASNAGIKITGVEIVNPVAEGKLFPLADTESTPDPGTAVLMELDLPENATENTVSVDKAVKDGNYTISGRYTPVTTAYYLAENDNGESSEFSYGEFTNKDDLDTKAAGATALKISYKVGNSEKTGYVIMPPIERNTCYKVLARITAGGQMNLTFVAQPWDVYTESISYSDQITVSEGGRIKWEDHQPDSNAEIVTDGEDIKCEFKIDTPSGAMWHASFIPVSGDVNAFGFARANTSGEVVTSPFAEGKVGEKATLTIRPLGSNLTQNNVAILRIVVKTTDGRTIAVVKNDVLSGNSSYNNKEYTITHSK